MWETIKNDPLLKSITVLILGVLSFGFAFNIMFGRNGGGMEQGMNGGYSLNNTLAYILSISVKLLLIGLVIVAIIALIKATKRFLIEGNEIKMIDSTKLESLKKDPVFKIAAIVMAAVLVIVLFASLFNLNLNNGYAMTGYRMNSYGYSAGASFTIVLGKFLLFISIVGLVISLGAYLMINKGSMDVKRLIPAFKEKATIKCSKCDYEADQEYKFCPSCGDIRVKSCTKCGAVVKNEWKCCPNCGNDSEIVKYDEGIKESIDESVIEPEESVTVDHQNTELIADLGIVDDRASKTYTKHEKKTEEIEVN